MKFTSLLFLFTCLFLASASCKEVPTPKENEGAEAPRHQAPESLNELMGTPKTAASKPTAQKLPPGHPPIGGAATGLMSDFTKVHAPPGVVAPYAGPHAGKARPSAASQSGPALKATGSGSQAELERCLKSFDAEGDQTIFRNAFTSVFHNNRGQRNPGAAEVSLTKLAEKHPTNAAIYRVLGYAAVDNGFQMARAMRYYLKAVELSPDYAEVHYALAFMYAMGDRAKGAQHFKKAMELGIKDERGIGPRFYPPKGQ